MTGMYDASSEAYPKVDYQEESEMDQLYPIAVLIDELKNEETAARLKAVKQLSTIALALGPERTREELLPFISEAVYDEDDVLLAITEQLGKLVPYVGGKEYAYTIMVPLEQLAAIEECVVRDQAALQLSLIAKEQLPVEHIELYFLPMIKRLASGDWFTTRCSSCALFSAAYSKSTQTSTQSELRNLFLQLCQDDTPMVRRAATTKLADFTTAIATNNSDSKNSESKKAQSTESNSLQNCHESKSCQNILKNDLFPIWNSSLIQDDQDSVRLASIDSALTFAKYLKMEDKFKMIFPIFLDLIADKSWRVRHVLAEKFTLFQREFLKGSNTEISENLMHGFVTLLQDSESEVRTAAGYQIEAFVKEVPEGDDRLSTIVNFMPQIQTMSQDCHVNVKAAVAKAVMDLAPLAGKDFTIEQLLPIFLQQLRDDSTEVRLNIIGNLSSVDSVIGMEQLASSLLPAILELAGDTKWRVRLAIISHIPLLADQLGKEVFEEKLSGLALDLLTDKVYAIREAACENIRRIVRIFEMEWVVNMLMPKLEELIGDKNYLRRMTCLFTIKSILEIKHIDKNGDLGKNSPRNNDTNKIDQAKLDNHNRNIKTKTDFHKKLIEKLLPLIIQLQNDNIPNVRFNVAICLESLREKSGEVKSALESLAKDSDSDVKYFSIRAQRSLGFIQ